jgi:hypothetical protein
MTANGIPPDKPDKGQLVKCLVQFFFSDVFQREAMPFYDLQPSVTSSEVIAFDHEPIEEDLLEPCQGVDGFAHAYTFLQNPI